MEGFKLRLKIGVNEFEAEGSQEYVQQEREVFLESISSVKQDGKVPNTTQLGQNPPPPPGGSHPPAPTDPKPDFPLADIQKIAKQEKEVVTLTALPTTEATKEQDAFVLLLLAHKVMRTVDNVPSNHLMEGMKQSGVPVDRLDTTAQKIPELVNKTGVKKGTKYRLTNPGIAKAKEVAAELVTHVG